MFFGLLLSSDVRIWSYIFLLYRVIFTDNPLSIYVIICQWVFIETTMQERLQPTKYDLSKKIYIHIHVRSKNILNMSTWFFHVSYFFSETIVQIFLNIYIFGKGRRLNNRSTKNSYVWHATWICDIIYN